MKFINNVKAIFSDKIVQICIIMCSIIFGIVKTQQGYAPNTVVDNIQRGVGSAICYYLLLNFAYYIFTRDYKFIFLKIKSFPNCIKKDFSWIIAFICLILFVFNFWLFYPGYMMHDWTWVMTNFDLNNHHPILYPFLFKHIATIFGNHIFVPLLFNLIPFYLGIYVLIISCYKKFQSKWCLLGLLPICIGNIFFNSLSSFS